MEYAFVLLTFQGLNINCNFFSVYREKTPYEKAQSEVNNPSMLSVKTSQSLVNSPKRGQKKEDGWKEVIRK